MNQRGKRFTDADVRTIKRNLHRLDKDDQLLVALLATTGMRLAEAYEISSEKKESGARYCIVGTKTEQSEQASPVPGGCAVAPTKEDHRAVVRT